MAPNCLEAIRQPLTYAQDRHVEPSCQVTHEPIQSPVYDHDARTGPVPPLPDRGLAHFGPARMDHSPPASSTYRADEARKFMRQVFELSADILPDYEQDRLVVRLHSMANPRSNRALRSLCDVLNDLKVCFPDTTLRLVFEATESR
jgi:hypothetical protein